MALPSAPTRYGGLPSAITSIRSAQRGARESGLTKLTKADMVIDSADGTLLEMQRSRAFECGASFPHKPLQDNKLTGGSNER